VFRRKVGRGEVIYIGSGLEAVYQETRMKTVRAYLASLLDPLLALYRTYEVEYRPGLLPHYVASRNVLLVHLLADTGNKWKKLRAREEFLPVENVRVRVRIPAGRSVRAASLLRAGRKLAAPVKGGWAEVTVPRVLIHEAVEIELA